MSGPAPQIPASKIKLVGGPGDGQLRDGHAAYVTDVATGQVKRVYYPVEGVLSFDVPDPATHEVRKVFARYVHKGDGVYEFAEEVGGPSGGSRRTT